MSKTEKQIPEAYKWIRGGALGIHPLMPGQIIKFESAPYYDRDNYFGGAWVADTNIGIPAKLDGFQEVKQSPEESEAG